jgi:lysophospholipase L1-like esterase
VLILLTVSQIAYGQAVKIMPLGDSLTSGYRQYASYRYDLWFDLIDAGFEVDFVGSLTTTYSGDPNPDLYPNYLTTFDRDHEGHSGAITNDLAFLARSVSARHQPDIVLLWVGVNDIWADGAGGVTQATFRMRDIIEGLRAGVPGVTILLALNPPYGRENAEFVEPLNEAVAGVAAELDSPQSAIILVDLYTGYNFESMTWDNVHQNRAGEEWVADKWFEVLAGILPLSNGFQINSGHAGAWFNPDTSGQGQLIDIEPESQFMFLAWFTYTDDGSGNPHQQHWLTAQGNYSGNWAVLPVYETLGGRFDDSRAVNSTVVGSVELSFDDCANGSASYTIDAWGVEGAFPLTRVIPGSDNVCQGLANADRSGLVANDGWDGAWYNPETAGQGFLIDVYPSSNSDDFIFVAWFTYGDTNASGQRWLTAQGPMTGTQADLAVYETTGGSFDDPRTVSSEQIGTMNVEFETCNSASVTYELTNESLSGSIDIVRVVPGTEALCEALAGLN